MSSFPASLDIPKRLSLSAQAAASMRKAIDDGTWKECLPSERRLCELFQVSRPTIRTALHLLAKEGLLEIRQGRRNRLLGQPRNGNSRGSQLIVLVTHEPVSHMAPSSYQGISEMRGHLAAHGFTTEVLVCPPRSARTQRAKLEAFVRQNRVFCCVLLSVSKELQQWFVEHSMPALVLGSCHQAVKLPSLDVDYRSVCRHAAGLFLSRGHRRIALIVPNSGVAGDLASEEGFCEAVAQRQSSDEARALIVRHNGTAQNIGTKLDALFTSAHPPTAFLVAKPQHVFIVIIYLLKRGLAVPEKISFMARDHDHLFETVSPPISHYKFVEETFADRLSRLMLQMVNQGYLSDEPNLIFPTYFAGGTVKQVS
ncbi:MAG: substrate-binding domain-containing protein [Opitutus sp.]